MNTMKETISKLEKDINPPVGIEAPKSTKRCSKKEKGRGCLKGGSEVRHYVLAKVENRGVNREGRGIKNWRGIKKKKKSKFGGKPAKKRYRKI